MVDILTREKQVDTVFDYIESLIPSDTLIPCSQWAEENRYMNSKASGRSGNFSFRNAPYCKEIVDCFSKNSSVQEVAIMKGVQLGLTTSVIENVIGYTMDVDPSPMMFVFPNEGECKSYKKVKIDNLIDNSGLRNKIAAETDNRNTRRTGDTALMVEFQGGFLKLASAGNPKQLRSTHIKKLFLDELDGYPDILKGEGSPVDIATKRTDSYIQLGRKICYNSTPLLAHKSKIYELYKKGDCRKFFVPCPICGEMQELVFYKSDGGLYPDEKAVVKDKTKTKPFGLLFDANACKEGDLSSVRYRCQHCGGDFKDYHKLSIEQRGEWRTTEKSKKPFYRSYHISALYSLTKPWENIVLDFLEAGKDPKKLQAFFNLDLGEPFVENFGGVEYQQVHRLKDENMDNNFVPDEALILTCCADVQRDRIECEVKAWGERFRCWGIDHRVFEGNTSDIYDPCWQKFKDIKDEIFTSGSGSDGGAGTHSRSRKLVDIMLVDSGDGELTDVVYDFCETFGEGLILPLKGFVAPARATEKFKIVPIKERESLSLVEIYVDKYKNLLSRYLSQEERIDDSYPDGWFTFANGYSDKYFRQLTNEKRIRKKLPSGVIKTVWEAHGRNEAFDLNVYNLAAIDLIILQTSLYVLGLEYPTPKAVFDYFKMIRNYKSETESGEKTPVDA